METVRETRILGVALVALLLCACATRMAYTNLDWFLMRSIDGLVSLEDMQRDQVRQSIEDLLGWHCATQLPAYVEWLGELEAQSRAGTLTAADLEHHAARVEEFWQAVVRQSWPVVADWLAGLNDKQVGELFESFSERNREIREEYLEPEAAEVHRKRVREMERSLQRFFGWLDPDQRRRVEAWSLALKLFAPHWLENRLNWQASLAEALKLRHDRAAFDAAAEAMLSDLRYGWSDEYRRVWGYNQRQFLELVADVHEMASDRQRMRFRGRLASLSRDFERLACAPDPASAQRSITVETGRT